MESKHIQIFVENIVSSFEQEKLIKITLSNKRNKATDLKTVIIKKIAIKKGPSLSFTYRHNTQDITKNYALHDGCITIQELLQSDFYQGDLFTSTENYHLIFFKNGKSSFKKKVTLNPKKPVTEHDRVKKRLIKTEDNLYLRELGVTTATFEVKKDMHDKYRQINKYVEIIDGIMRSATLDVNYTVVDMGAGKGYLTLSLYDYLHNILDHHPQVIGVEMREDLVKKGNGIAQKIDFRDLKFIQGTIQDVVLPHIDVLIALHACDIATDEAIYRGIKSDASVIICAPCCHKQVRKQIDPKDELGAITQYGILKERQSEILTDAIRALVLEAYGYKTKVFEFIATEHTPKNILIVGIKENSKGVPDQSILNKIDSIKNIHGLEYQYLERLLQEG